MALYNLPPLPPSLWSLLAFPPSWLTLILPTSVHESGRTITVPLTRFFFKRKLFCFLLLNDTSSTSQKLVFRFIQVVFVVNTTQSYTQLFKSERERERPTWVFLLSDCVLVWLCVKLCACVTPAAHSNAPVTREEQQDFAVYTRKSVKNHRPTKYRCPFWNYLIILSVVSLDTPRPPLGKCFHYYLRQKRRCTSTAVSCDVSKCNFVF